MHACSLVLLFKLLTFLVFLVFLNGFGLVKLVSFFLFLGRYRHERLLTLLNDQLTIEGRAAVGV